MLKTRPSVLLGSMALLASAPSPGFAQIAFTPGIINAGHDGVTSVYAADIDGDGDLDVLSAESDTWDIVWWENTAGDGSGWTEHTIDASFQVAAGVSAADIDGDGDMDVLGAALFGDKISWWENTAGDGSLWTEVTIAASFDGASSVFAADLDGDGDMDVLGTAESADDITWWENTAGDGSMWAETTIDGDFDGALRVFAADLDGDGDMDILGAAQDANDIVWWKNTNGDGSLWQKSTIDEDFLTANGVHAADVDGDGDLDVLGASFSGGDIAWWKNTMGDGSAWTETTIDGDFSGARSVFPVDMDGDGDIDVLGAAENDSDITWWENSAGDGSAWTEHIIDGDFVGARDAYAADLDGDGDPDVLGGSNSGSEDNVVWWKNSHSGRTTKVGTKTTLESSFSGARSPCHGDVDGDGDVDVVAGANGADSIAWWKNTSGDGTTWTKTTIVSSFDAETVYCSDVNGDGDLDVLGAGYSTKEIAWWDNTAGDGSSWTKMAMVQGEFSHAVLAADIDGDGDEDIVGATRGTARVSWWANPSGDGGAWTRVTITTGAYPQRIVAGDMDGDGDVDIVGASTNNQFLRWWENSSGDGSTWIERSIDTSYARALSLGDIDGDGHLDVAVNQWSPEEVVWYENANGAGTSWTKRTIITSYDSEGVFIADFNHDGRLDVLAGRNDGVLWLENTDGSGTTWSTRTVTNSSFGGAAVLGVDVDGDGDRDFLGASSWVHSIAWWANNTVILNQGLVISGTTGTGNNVGWRLLAPPCGSQTRSGMTGINITGDDEVRRYDESAGSGDARWLSTGSSDALPQGSGFAVYLYDDATQEVGADFGVAFGACTPTNADVVVSTLDLNEEWFLAGNPYMQSFDLSSLSGTGFQTTYKLWNPSTTSYTDVTAQAGSADVIKVGQGFFVQRTTVGAGGTSLTFDDAGKTSGGTFVGKTAGGGYIRLPISLQVVDANGHVIARDESSSILVAGDATLSWDHYESGKLKPMLERWATVALIGDRTGRPAALSLLSLPSELGETVTIPLQIDAVGISGRATLSWGDLAGLPDHWHLQLRDLDTGFDQDLRRVSTYSFPLTGTATKSGAIGGIQVANQSTPRFELVITPAAGTGTEQDELPAHYALEQNYPNPFNPETVIRFALPEAGPVTVTVHDLLGREISRLVDGPLPTGWHEINFDATRLASGTYVYRLSTPHHQMSRAMHLIR